MNKNIKYKGYYIDGVQDRVKWKELLKLFMKNSDYFSFIMFKYSENEKTKKTSKDIQKKLSKYKVLSKKVMKWPLMETWDTRHIYKITVYKTCNEAFDILNNDNCLWDWAYPDYPEDLCFYKNNLCLFGSTSHEKFNMLYLNNNSPFSIEFLENIGFGLHLINEFTEDDIYNLDTLKTGC